MSNRQKKLQIANESVLQPLLKIVTNGNYIPNNEGIIKIIIQLKNRFCILVGDNDSFRVSEMTKWDLEDILNLLRQFSYLTYNYTLSGEAFYIFLKIPFKANSNSCKIIFLKHHKKVA